jgi:hypothetical protein
VVGDWDAPQREVELEAPSRSSFAPSRSRVASLSNTTELGQISMVMSPVLGDGPKKKRKNQFTDQQGVGVGSDVPFVAAVQGCLWRSTRQTKGKG